MRFLISLVLLGGTLDVVAQTRECVVTKPVNPAQFESWINTISPSSYNSAFRSKAITTPYRIPVIVHVIHNGEPVGQGINISFEQISSQLEVLNADFNRKNADTTDTPLVFANIASSIEIEFVPALIFPSGDSLVERGVERINRNSNGFNPPPYDYNYISTTIQPATYWDPDQYLNIWVMAISGNILGIAQFPQDALPDLETNLDPKTDGIVVNYTNYGNTGNVIVPFHKGRTATHEIGHWLGLHHLWGPLDGNDPNNCTEDDLVNDTPNQDEPSISCPTSSTSSCNPPTTREMWENYMDYTWDDCMNMFTQGQVVRMTTVIENAPRRFTLLSSPVSNKFNQTITFGPLPNKTFGDPFIILSATSSSGLPITYESSDTLVADIHNDTLFIAAAGQASIIAKQAGDINFNVAADVSNLMVVDKSSQIISFDQVGSKKFNDTAFELSASASSGLPVVFTSSNLSILNITGITATIDSVGAVLITASQVGNKNYLAADMDQSLLINKSLQEINFTTLTDYQDTVAVIPIAVESSSALAVDFIVSGENQQGANIINNKLTGFATGKITIMAKQTGDAYYEAALDVVQQICINPSPVILGDTLTHHIELSTQYNTGLSWYFEDEFVSDETNFNADTIGEYRLEVSIDGCITKTWFFIDQVVGLENIINDNEITIFPNPVRSILNIDLLKLPDDQVEIHIFNMKGMEIINQRIDHIHSEIDVELLNEGVYVLVLKHNQQVLQYKFIKK